MMPTRVLIAGVSTRGIAESAARAGYDVIAVDGFGDLDLRACARAVLVARTVDQGGDRFSVPAALRAARGVACEAVCYVASFENHPDAVGALARRGTLWGNPPAVLRRVRDPVRLARALTAHGLPGPAVRLSAPRAPARTRWLAKPRASGGGSGITRWRGGRVPVGSYLQQWIAGVPGSIVFAADGRRAVPLGVSRLLAGERAFGARPFRYCGNILGGADARLAEIAGRIADAVTAEFRLVGVNGIDFVVRRGVPYPLEVNPRYTAALELVERAHGLGIFETHARACAGELPEAPPHRRTAVIGKAIVYARRSVVIGDTSGWLEDESVRDIPTPGQRIGRGHPVCTVFAHAPDPAACHAALVRRARSVYHEIEARELRIA
jgi:predicted ATP-grasp superfamily ATP-dependent carboligase